MYQEVFDEEVGVACGVRSGRWTDVDVDPLRDGIEACEGCLYAKPGYAEDYL